MKIAATTFSLAPITHLANIIGWLITYICSERLMIVCMCAAGFMAFIIERYANKLASIEEPPQKERKVNHINMN